VVGAVVGVFVGIVQAFQKVSVLEPLAPTQSEPPILVTTLADKAAQRDQRDRFDGHLFRCRRVNLGLHGGDDCSMVGVVTWSLPRNRKARPAEPPANGRL
jgi:hypothetical protein